MFSYTHSFHRHSKSTQRETGGGKTTHLKLMDYDTDTRLSRHSDPLRGPSTPTIYSMHTAGTRPHLLGTLPASASVKQRGKEGEININSTS